MIEEKKSDYTRAAQVITKSGDIARYGFPVSFVRNIQKQKTSGKIFLRMQAWMSAAESITLWIRGPGQTPMISEVTLTALYVVSIVTGTHSSDSALLPN
jgi:hypothetical protein